MSRPPTLVMEALVDAFFDRMNWFTMIFHETSFRASAQRIFSNDSWERDELGPVLAVLMVSALGLQCVVHDPSWAGHKLLAEASLGSSVLLDALITEVRIHLLDLLDDCCIETVQVCSLLGTYYIFHASPTLAWSILGLSVRTAYALALHCDDDDQDVDPIVAQVRRRNWNHITVADTFAAMVYGRPASLDAAFSYLHPLQDLDDTRVSAALASHPLLAPSDHSRVPVTRATFHFLKARLYEIIRQALNRFRVLRLQNPISAEDLASLVQAVQYSRSRLEAWREDLPPIFDCDPDSGRESLDSFTGDESLSPEDQTVLRHLSLQSLTLQVTYDSAVIFVHRPLLEYRVAVESRPVVPSHLLEVVRESLDLSVNAALRISRVPVVRLETQFSISFVLMNFFTAGVILCIPPTIWPFSAVAHDAKAGTLRIIRASRSLRDVTQIAPHTEKLLTELLRLSLQQEVDLGLQHDRVDRQSEMNKQTLEQAQHASSRELAYREDDEEPQIHANLQHQNPILDSELLSAPGTSTAMRPGLALNQDTSVGDHMNIVPPSSDAGHHDDHMVPGFDIAWPPLGYDGQRNQVDSQLDEVFGTFGQSKLELAVLVCEQHCFSCYTAPTLRLSQLKPAGFLVLSTLTTPFCSSIQSCS